MTHIILTGPSGIGKTHILQYLGRRFNYASIDTGDVFKAMLALPSFDSFPDPGKVLLGKEALHTFFKQDLPKGVQLYEKMKKDGAITGNQVIYFIEMLRAVCPDLPSRMVAEYSKWSQHPEATTAISNEEYHYLYDALEGPVLTVRLNCSVPYNRRKGDNRSQVTEYRGEGVQLDYVYPEESHDVAYALAVDCLGLAPPQTVVKSILGAAA